MQRSRLATMALVFLGEGAELDLQFLAASIHVVDVEQHEEHAARQQAVAAEIDPLMGGGALDGDVARAHDALLARVEDELEDAFEHDAVVEADGAVHGRLDAGSKVDQARYRAVVDM